MQGHASSRIVGIVTKAIDAIPHDGASIGACSRISRVKVHDDSINFARRHTVVDSSGYIVKTFFKNITWGVAVRFNLSAYRTALIWYYGRVSAIDAIWRMSRALEHLRTLT